METKYTFTAKTTARRKTVYSGFFTSKQMAEFHLNELKNIFPHFTQWRMISHKGAA